MKLWRILSVVLFGLTMMVQAKPKPDELRFVLYYPQVPPYMYQDRLTQQVVGMVPEVLQEFFQQQNIRINYVSDNRTRAEHLLYQGKVDAMLLAKEWSKEPGQAIFSVPLIEHKDYLFSLTPIAVQGTLADWVKGKAICTRQYYVYEALAPFFLNNATARVDSSSEQTQLRMLLNGRCDYAYMNEHVAYWLLKHQFPDQHVYRSTEGFGAVGLTIAFHPRWEKQLQLFNRYLEQQKSQGLIDQWLKFYITKP